jgi:hypothetical protein
LRPGRGTRSGHGPFSANWADLLCRAERWARGRAGLLGRAPLENGLARGRTSAGSALLDCAGMAMGHVRELGLRAKLIKEMNFRFIFFRSIFFIYEFDEYLNEFE